MSYIVVDQDLLDFALSFLVANMDSEVEEMMVESGLKPDDARAAARAIDERV